MSQQHHTGHKDHKSHGDATEHTEVAEVSLDFCFCGTELAGLEQYVAGQPGVTSAAVDRTRSVLHVAYDPDQTDLGRLQSLLQERGYGCECTQSADSCC